eukprot:Platyproteum_vivax@DN7384_c1_g2_i1.p1
MLKCAILSLIGGLLVALLNNRVLSLRIQERLRNGSNPRPLEQTQLKDGLIAGGLEYEENLMKQTSVEDFQDVPNVQTEYELFDNIEDMADFDLIDATPVMSSDKQLECPLCSVQFLRQDVYATHMQRHASAAVKLECPVCNSRFTTKIALSRHVKTHDGRTDLGFTCSECGKTFASRGNLNRHVSTHIRNRSKAQRSRNTLGLKNRRCIVCAETFPSIEERNRHMREIHREILPTVKHTRGTQVPNTKCEYCGKQYSSSSSRQRHIGIKHGLSKLPVQERPVSKWVELVAEDLKKTHKEQSQVKPV